tara:strand:+ start:113 stop:535 length:423 start_codon:yes stop_codon:yes gene_type:complete
MNHNHQRGLAFDYGLKHIGVAIGNSQFETSKALAILRSKDGTPVWIEIEKLISEWKPDLLLVGLPLNMDGSDSAMSARANKFGRRLQGRFNLKVKMIDERLSSREAKSFLKEKGHRGDYHKNPADSVAAQLILDSWFREL